MNADLHCHSSASDGLLAPADVARRAAGRGVEMLALTDHDDVAGLAGAREAAVECGLRFVAGVEISVGWAETSVHVVGLGFDPGDPALAQGLAQLRAGRLQRASRIARALEGIGIDGALDGALRFAQHGGIVGRAHFARFLVERGTVGDMQTAFDRYLGRGKPGYVAHQWARLDEAVGWIVRAGGVAVMAHPGRYRVDRPQLERLFGEFRDCGGTALEVVSGAHTRAHVRGFARLARRFGLMASRGSDFHGPGEGVFDLGGMPALPDDLRPVWHALA